MNNRGAEKEREDGGRLFGHPVLGGEGGYSERVSMGKQEMAGDGDRRI